MAQLIFCSSSRFARAQVDEELAYHVHQRPFPGLVSGRNAWNELQATWRDVWVLDVVHEGEVPRGLRCPSNLGLG